MIFLSAPSSIPKAVSLTNADGVEQRIGLLGSGDGLVHFHLAAGVNAIGQQDDCPARVFGRVDKSSFDVAQTASQIAVDPASC